MAMTRSAVRWGSMRIARRLSRAVPFLGTVIALVTIGAAIRRKGWLGGTANTAVDAIPFVGAAKMTAEVVRGRDFIRDRQPRSL